MIFDFTAYKKIVCIGDLHGRFVSFIKSIQHTSDTLYILTGDVEFGYGHIEAELEVILRQEYTVAKNNNTVAIIRGNHDYPSYFHKKSAFRIDLTRDAPHIVLIPDYSILKTAEHNILCVGGAISIDRTSRIEGFNWWPDEKIQRFTSSFKQEISQHPCDIIVSHAAPLYAEVGENNITKSVLVNAWGLYDSKVLQQIKNERKHLDALYDMVPNIKTWVFGHYHRSVINQYKQTKFVSLNTMEKFLIK